MSAQIRDLAGQSVLLVATYSAIFTVFGSWNLRYHFPVQLALIMIIGCGASVVDAALRSDPIVRAEAS